MKGGYRNVTGPAYCCIVFIVIGGIIKRVRESFIFIFNKLYMKKNYYTYPQ